MILLCTLLNPCAVLPGMLVNIGNNAGSERPQFKGKAIGIALINRVIVEA